MTRLAFLSPLPPAATGIADYAAEVLALLSERHQIDLFHDQAEVDLSRLPSGCRVREVAQFLPTHAERPYDLAVFQLGNANHHAFLYRLLSRVPGLLVLHDLVLHHSRARAFLDSPEVRAYARDPSSPAARDAALPRVQAYRDEVAYTYPDQAGRLDEAHLATVGDLLPYAYPLFRIPVEHSRATAAHNEFMVEAIRAEVPSATVLRIPMAVAPVGVPTEAVRGLRRRHGISPEEFVVGTFGLLTREKRVETVARAVARAAALRPRMRLLLVGPVPEPGRLESLLRKLGVAERTVVTGRVEFAELPGYLEVADVAVHLRYPTARETSAALLRLLAQARPTVISDLEHLADIPAAAVIRADPTDEEGEVARAILRLLDNPRARERLGRNARTFVEREHSAARCLEGYERAIQAARQAPDPAARPWPAHWAGC